MLVNIFEEIGLYSIFLFQRNIGITIIKKY